jgi:hypothetical protein
VREIVGRRVGADVVERAALDRMASTLGVKAVETRAGGSSKESIRVGLGVSGPLVKEWLSTD